MKIPFLWKTTAFIASVISLSWCFAGYRILHHHSGNLIVGWATLVTGIVLTLLFLLVQAYWIYVEEKTKGTLHKQVKVFDWIYNRRNA